MLSSRYSVHVVQRVVNNNRSIASRTLATYNHKLNTMFERSSNRIIGAPLTRPTLPSSSPRSCGLMSLSTTTAPKPLPGETKPTTTVYTVPKKVSGLLKLHYYFFFLNIQFLFQIKCSRFPDPAHQITQFIDEASRICQPDKIHICDGSETEYENLVNLMVHSDMAVPLPKYENCYLVRTDPRDVARVESKTVISTEKKRDVVPKGENPHPGAVPNWMSPEELEKKLGERFPGCMKGNGSKRVIVVVGFIQPIS